MSFCWVIRRVPAHLADEAKAVSERCGWDTYRDLAWRLPINAQHSAELVFPASFDAKCRTLLLRGADAIFRGRRLEEVKGLVSSLVGGELTVSVKMDTGYGAPRELSPVRLRQARALLKAMNQRRVSAHAGADEATCTCFASWRALLLEAAHNGDVIVVTPV